MVVHVRKVGGLLDKAFLMQEKSIRAQTCQKGLSHYLIKYENSSAKIIISVEEHARKLNQNTFFKLYKLNSLASKFVLLLNCHIIP